MSATEELDKLLGDIQKSVTEKRTKAETDAKAAATERAKLDSIKGNIATIAGPVFEKVHAKPEAMSLSPGITTDRHPIVFSNGSTAEPALTLAFTHPLDVLAASDDRRIASIHAVPWHGGMIVVACRHDTIDDPVYSTQGSPINMPPGADVAEVKDLISIRVRDALQYIIRA